MLTSSCVLLEFQKLYNIYKDKGCDEVNTIPFKVNKNIIHKIGGYSIASSENNYTKFDFQFSDDWNKVGIQVSATMFFDADNIPDPVLLTMRNDNTGYCYLPSALKDEHGILKLGLTGAYVDDNNEKIVINTLLTSMPIGPGAFMTKYPANDIYKDMLARIASFDRSKQDRLICKNGITIDKDSNISVDDNYVITTGNIPKYVDPIKKEIEQLDKNKLNGMSIRCTDLSELLNYEPGIYLALLNCAGFYESSQLVECEVIVDEYGVSIYISQAGLFYFITKEQISNGEMPEKLTLNKNEINAFLDKKADKTDVDNSIDEIKADLDTKENISNKKNAIDGSSVFYPSNIAVKNYVAKELIEPKSEISQLKLSKADLVQSQNLFDWSKLLTVKSNIFTVNKTEDEGYHITGRTTNIYSQILANQELSLEDGKYYICDNVTNNAIVSVCCQLILIDTDGGRTYYRDTKVTIDKTKYTSIFLSVQTDNTVGEVDSVIYPILCKYEDSNIPYLPNKVADGVSLLARHIPKIKDEILTKTDDNLKKKENISNKVNTIDFPSTNYYPSAKAVWDYVTSKLSTPLADIESLKADKLDKTDFNSYKTVTDKAIQENTNSIKANATAIDKCATDIANKSALISKNQINVTTDKSTGVVLNDSSDCNIVNLICDEKDNSKQIAFYRKNLFDFNNIYANANDSVSNIVVNKDNKSISFTTSETGANSGVYIRHTVYGIDYTKLSGKPVTLSFDIQSDINCKIGVQFAKYSYNYFDITPTKQRIVVTDTVDINKLNKALCFYTNKTKANITISNIQIEVNNIATDYEDCDCQKVTLADADVNSLHTYYPSTTVISDSDFILTYIADTKNYIDNKFTELANVIVASASSEEVV